MLLIEHLFKLLPNPIPVKDKKGKPIIIEDISKGPKNKGLLYYDNTKCNIKLIKEDEHELAEIVYTCAPPKKLLGMRLGYWTHLQKSYLITLEKKRKDKSGSYSVITSKFDDTRFQTIYSWPNKFHGKSFKLSGLVDCQMDNSSIQYGFKGTKKIFVIPQDCTGQRIASKRM